MTIHQYIFVNFLVTVKGQHEYSNVNTVNISVYRVPPRIVFGLQPYIVAFNTQTYNHPISYNFLTYYV